MKKIVVYILLFIATLPLKAQDDPEYKMEVGAGIGVANYLGDFNANLTKDLQPMVSALLRYNLNPYMGIKLNISYSKLKGSSENTDSYYPAYAGTPYSFRHSLTDVGLTYEYNFWPYGTGKDYRGAQRFTPYIYGGIGTSYAKPDKKNHNKSVFTANLPIGIGIKYKVGQRTNIGLEWGIHFTLSDELDGVKDPYKITSSGMFKNTDCYSTLQLTVSYSFRPKCLTCHNEDE